MSDYSSIYAKVTDQIIEQMEKGIIPWKQPWKAISGSYNAKSRKYYSFLNQMILWMLPGAYASFKQWNEMGCKIKKGEKATMIMEWFYKDIKIEEDDAETGETKSRTFRKWYPRLYPVFHESQVDGYEAPEADEIKKPDPIDAAENVINEYIKFSGIAAIHRDEESSRAYYSPIRDYIRVPMIDQYENANEFYSTLFHEMVHSTGHSSRLDRGLNKKLAAFGSEDYSKEELVAELGSAMICTRLGIDTPETFTNSTAYLQSWLKALKNDKSLLVSAASYAEKATRYILQEA